jgi:hypothetical protein
MSFAQISRYYEFVRIILSRSEDVSQKLQANTKTLMDSVIPGSGRQALTNDQATLHEDGSRLNSMLHLEIESFYIFAKVLLDKVANAIQFYFGLGRAASLRSHDRLVKNIGSYSQQKGLRLPQDFVATAERLKADIADYRDKEISHQNDPGQMSGTMWDGDGRGTRIAAISLYSNKVSPQKESKDLRDLFADIEAYLREVMELITSNEERTRLRRTGT